MLCAFQGPPCRMSGVFVENQSKGKGKAGPATPFVEHGGAAEPKAPRCYPDADASPQQESTEDGCPGDRPPASLAGQRAGSLFTAASPVPAPASCEDVQFRSHSAASLPDAVAQRPARSAMVVKRRERLTQGSTSASATIVGSKTARPRLECSICMETLTPSAETARNCATLPSCGHVFHRACIAPWLWKNSCPMCRCPVQQRKLHAKRRS